MKAFVVDRYKSKAGLRFGDMPNPELRDDGVMVQVCAAGVNPLDAKIRDGEFKLVLPYRLPLVLGNDVAGIVVRVGSKVRRFKGWRRGLCTATSGSHRYLRRIHCDE